MSEAPNASVAGRSPGRREFVHRTAWLTAGVAAGLLNAGCDPREFARRHGARQRLSIATGGTGGVYYPYGGAIAAVITRHVSNVEATAEVTGGSVDNLKFLHQDQADLAFTLADTLADAYAGHGPFAGFGQVPARALARLYTNYTHVVAGAGGPLRTLEDLRGRIVSTGSPGSGTEVIAHRILSAAGLEPSRDIRMRSLGASGSVEAFKDGKLDAFFWSGGVPTGAVLDLATSPGRRIRLLPTAAVIPTLEARHGAGLYQAAVIPGGVYPHVDVDTAVVGVANLLAVDQRMNDELAHEITRTLFEHKTELVAVHPEARHLEVGFSSTGSPVPFHDGALAFYRSTAGHTA